MPSMQQMSLSRRQPLTREQVWSAANDAAEAGAAKAAAGPQEGAAETAAAGDDSAGGAKPADDAPAQVRLEVRKFS